MKIKIPKDKYNNLTSKKKQTLYDLKKNKNIVINMLIRGLQQWYKDKDIYEEVTNDSEPLISTMHRTTGKIRKKRIFEKKIIKYFEV